MNKNITHMTFLLWNASTRILKHATMCIQFLCGWNESIPIETGMQRTRKQLTFGMFDKSNEDDLTEFKKNWSNHSKTCICSPKTKLNKIILIKWNTIFDEWFDEGISTNTMRKQNVFNQTLLQLTSLLLINRILAYNANDRIIICIVTIKCIHKHQFLLWFNVGSLQFLFLVFVIHTTSFSIYVSFHFNSNRLLLIYKTNLTAGVHGVKCIHGYYNNESCKLRRLCTATFFLHVNMSLNWIAYWKRK